jgi:hypothetical protein
MVEGECCALSYNEDDEWFDDEDEEFSFEDSQGWFEKALLTVLRNAARCCMAILTVTRAQKTTLMKL